MSSLKIPLADAVRLDMEIEQMDVVTAFLIPKLSEEIYMSQLKGKEDGRQKIPQQGMETQQSSLWTQKIIQRMV